MYGTPLDPVLFDIPRKAYVVPSNGAGVCPALASDKAAFDGDESESLEEPGTNQYATAFQGLLDAEPLHFICCSASDGARVEKTSTQGNGFGKIMAPGAVASGNNASQFFCTATPVSVVPTSLAAVEQELQLLKVTSMLLKINSKTVTVHLHDN